jgi:putative copper export protein/methionine-rich copper-binding protein CopC
MNSRPRTRAAWRAAAILSVLGGAAVLTLATPAQLDAHARLERSVPSAGARVDAPPADLRFWFSEAIELAFARVRLIGPGGDTIALGTPSLIGSDGRALAVPVAGAVAPGRYEVRWHVTARDGHPSEGRFAFEVAGRAPDSVARDTAASTPAGPSATADTGAQIAPPSAAGLETPAMIAVRWVGYVALFLVLGAGLFRALIVPRLTVVRPGLDGVAGAAFARAGRVALAAALALLAADLARLWGEVAVVGASWRAPLAAGGLRDLLFGTTWGWGWLAQVVGAVVLAVAYPRVRAMTPRGSRVALVGTVAVVVGAAAAGHAMSASFPMLMVIVAGAHLLGAAGWLGVLSLVLIVGIPSAAFAGGQGGRETAVVALIAAFSPVALWCASLAALTGVIMAWVHLGSLGALWATPYGWTLLVKLALLGVVATVGAYNWRRLRPTLGTAPATARLRRSAATELTIAAMVLAVTAVLVALPTPGGVPHESVPARTAGPAR